jgi:hypothetical protein
LVDYVSISDNYFDKKWSGARRIKNVVMLLEWIRAPAQLQTRAHTYEPLSQAQEGALLRAIELFDQVKQRCPTLWI